MRIFDAHFLIIDYDFPITENQGYLPPSFMVEDYNKATAHLKVQGGALVSGFLDLNVENALKSIYQVNPEALMFGTDLPSTRAKRPFNDSDIRLIQDLFDEKAAEQILFHNAQSWYFK